MDYKLLNDNQRKRMKQISNSDFKMEWENPEFLDVLAGQLPKIRQTQQDKGANVEISSLEKLYSQYNFFKTDRDVFLKNIKELINTIRNKVSNWYGLDFYTVEESIRQQEFCLISGEGGIGKSYFIKCLEEEFEKNGIPHLCIYGKFEKDISNIDVNEIIREGTKGFVFMVDAINEMSEEGQEDLLSMLETLVTIPNIRIILTHRTNSMDAEILGKYENIAKSLYSFSGVSFESALNELLKSSVPDIYKYEEILYSNNALLLSMLCSVLSDEKLVEGTENSIASITFILESYIKNSIKKTFKGTIPNSMPIEIWKDTKRVANWMYTNDTKEIDRHNLMSTVNTGEVFVQTMRQAGFLSVYDYDDKQYYFFAIDSLTDFLIARSIFDELTEKSFDEQVAIISRKTDNLYNAKEAIMIAIFDKFAPDYQYIKQLLEKANLTRAIQYETLNKINFKKENISDFLQVFRPVNTEELILNFGGYTDKPFNCTNYLNSYYKSSTSQLRELSSVLAGARFHGHTKGRLKNILYFLTLNNKEDRRCEEAFYYALWCCAAPNKDIRCLAMKLLYEVVRQSLDYKNQLIEEYEYIIDPYIKEAIIYVLTHFLEDDTTSDFLRKLICDEPQLLAKSIKRISVYLKDCYGYIHWKRNNLYNFFQDAKVSDSLNDIFIQVDIMNKDFLPFRYWGEEHVDMHTRFLDVDKQEIFTLNRLLEEKFQCVRTGECNGRMVFEDYIEKEYGIYYGSRVLDQNSFFASFELVLKEIFSMFEVPHNKSDRFMGEEDFQHSLFMKCIDIAIGIYYGSLMCNYYTNQFATYNNYQENIGYEVYDPIEYGEDVYIATPIPTYQDFIEKLGDLTVNRIEIPVKKDLAWVKDVSITRNNLLSLLQPIVVKGVEWILLAGRVSLHESLKNETEWKDTYDVWCCTSEQETINEDGKARYLTIELNDYAGNMEEYEKSVVKPWLCKDVKNINYHSEIFDNTSLVLPPAELIRYFKLKPILADMSWVDNEGEKVILCNNNKNSYYKDPIGGTVFIRKEYLDKYLEVHPLKYFAFTERYIPQTGFADETSLHFEIQNGVIIKEILNCDRGEREKEETNPLCLKCPHGFNNDNLYDESAMKEYLELILGNQYLSWEDEEI